VVLIGKTVKKFGLITGLILGGILPDEGSPLLTLGGEDPQNYRPDVEEVLQGLQERELNDLEVDAQVYRLTVLPSFEYAHVFRLTVSPSGTASLRFAETDCCLRSETGKLIRQSIINLDRLATEKLINLVDQSNFWTLNQTDLPFHREYEDAKSDEIIEEICMDGSLLWLEGIKGNRSKRLYHGCLNSNFDQLQNALTAIVDPLASQ